MKEISIYIDREDQKEAESEEKYRFLHGILTEMGINLEDVWPEPIAPTVPERIKLRKYLGKNYDMELIENIDRSAVIYHEGDPIATWYTPRYILHRDLDAKQHSKRFFFEMILRFEYIGEDNDRENIED